MSDDEVLRRLDAALDRMVAGRRWVITDTVVEPAGRLCERLVRRGALPSLVLGARHGTGEPPDGTAAVDVICLDLPDAPTMMASVRAAMTALHDLPDDIVARIDRFDPGGRARVFGPIFDDGQPVAGRAVFGARLPAWQALEDKTVIDAIWDACRVTRAPSQVVPVQRAALAQAARELDQGYGTVWAADNREGFHGGAQGTFWVADEPGAERAFAALSASADHARVMPFLEGLPCSIHGLVFPDHVVTTRPAELLTLRFADRSGLLYARTSSAWWPGVQIVQAMRDVAVRVGTHLRETMGYRGAFTLDGVWTHEGFRPTELNPRVGAALGQVMPGISGYLVHTALVEGVDLDVDPRELEQAVRRRSMERWAAGVMVMTRTRFAETREARLRWSGEAWIRVGPDAPADATARWGPAGTGGIVFCFLDAESTPFGPSVAPQAAAFIAWVDAHLDTGIGDVRPAPWPI